MTVGRDDIGSAENGSHSKKTNDSRGNGCSCKAILLAFMFVVAMTTVGLSVYFTRPPCPKCSTGDIWEQCKVLAEEKDECLCETEKQKTVLPPPPPTPKPKVTGLRLNKTLIPVHYNVELKPDIYSPEPSLKFDGHVEIWMRCDDVTDRLVLHMWTLRLDNSTIEFREDGPEGRELEFLRWEEDADRQFFLLYLKSALNKGTMYYFKTVFKGTLKQYDMGGFYTSSYKQDGQERYVASTQFQPTKARRAFPCFDEPSFKSTFNVTIVRKPGYTALANMDLLYTENRDDGFVADVFQKSVVMPVYLVAFAVSDFVQKNKTTDAGTFVRHWGRRDYADQLDFTLNFAGELIEAFENYTGIPHQVSKTDQIAVPGFKADAMENWGLIVYREEYIYYNPKFSMTSEKQYVVQLAAHELAHQWFGNLVTCDWWDDTFLNEAMASYFEVFGTEAVQPTWDTEDDLLLSGQAAMRIDSKTSASAMRQPSLEHNHEVQGAFGTITYRKGAAVIRMIAYFLGHDTFRRAVQHYLRNNAYKTVKHTDLYNALEKQAQLDGRVTWDEEKTNLSIILSSWIEQPGHPVVTIINRGGGRYRIAQNRYLLSPGEGSNDQALWIIPLTYTGKAQLEQKQSNLTWFSERETDLQGLDQDFIIGNYAYQGFYRVDYDQGTWDKIIDQLNNNHELINKHTRAELMHDMGMFVNHKYREKTELDFLRLTEYLQNETEWLPWKVALENFRRYGKMFYNTETYDEWHRYFMDRVLTNLYDHVGWDVPVDESPSSAALRQNILEAACSGGYAPCITRVMELYRKWMLNKENNPIHPDLRQVVYCHAVASGGLAEWNFAYEMYFTRRTEYIGSGTGALLKALACTRKQWILKYCLNFALRYDLRLLVEDIGRNPIGKNLLWEMLLTKQLESTQRLLETLTETYSTPDDLRMFEVYAGVISTDKTASMFDSVKETIKKNIDWMNQNEAPMREWLLAVNAKQSHVIPLSQDQSIPNTDSSISTNAAPGLFMA